MKTLIFVIAVSLFYVPCLKGQYVTIPDQNFINWISTSSVSGCLNGIGQLDTTCSALLNDTIVDCSYSAIVQLDGIQFFKNLKYLDCSNNFLDSLPPLPASLQYLNCYYNNIQKISSLPDSLILLDVYINKLLALPELPGTLKWLGCSGNSGITLPALPAGLISLYCRTDLLDSLPPLPNHLDTLDCSINLLTKLPSFPNSLHVLSCQQNQLTVLHNSVSLKYLSCSYNEISSLGNYDSLQYLYCGYNNIQRLPLLSNSLNTLSCINNNIDSIIFLPNNIVSLDCGTNQLKSLGTRLPDSLQYMNCSNNRLTALPPLPALLTNLACTNNLLTELPALPTLMSALYCRVNPNLQCLPKLTSINFLWFDSTAIKCLPNYGNVTASIPPLDSVPLCTANNPNGCPFYTSIPQIKELKFSLYPNPASDRVMLGLNEVVGEMTLRLMDITGREIQKAAISQMNYELSLEKLQAGIYFIQLSDGTGGIGVKKLIVQK